MLIKLELENFKSFKEFTELDLKPTNYKILSQTNVFNDSVLKGAIFVGGNATGKTNIILALKILLDLLFREKVINLTQYRCLFSERDTIKLAYEFNINSSIINYRIEYDTKKKLMIEKLTLDDKVLLERIGDSGKSYITEIENITDLDKGTLLLRTIYFNTKFHNYPILQEWFKFLDNSTYIDASHQVKFKMRGSGEELLDYLDEFGTESINNFFNEHNFKYQIEYRDRYANLYETEAPQKDVFFNRENIETPIPFSMESLGNRNLLKMLPQFFRGMSEGGMLVIDEFSSAFHNELEELLIQYFMKHAKNSQIFLVTHSTNLLSNTLFRPDQEYAVEFKGENGSSIYRFSQEKPREAQNIEKMYVSGCFGGIPGYSND